MVDSFIICIAGLLGGMLNAVAGGGSFITLPTLLFLGVGPVSANTTGTAALLPGYIVSAWRFRHDIEYPRGLNLTAIALIAILGGSLGAILLLVTGRQLFSALIPWLILFATAAFVIGPRLMKTSQSDASHQSRTSAEPTSFPVCSALGLLALCILGGYFNGGLGIMILAALSLIGQTNLRGMNGVKNIISALLTAIAVVVYVIGGTIDGSHLPLLSASAVVGGYVGAVLAYRVSQRALRWFVIFVGCVLTIVFFVR